MTFPTTHPALARALAARGYEAATSVQVAVLDEAARSRDLLVSAQTGSGKTVAFGLAFAATLLGDAERFDSMAEPLALIVAPTRELAMQVQRELSWLYAETGARVITCVGGMDVRAEARQLGFGAHIVVGTPGRLRDHIERRRLDLSQLKTIVLDEADEMLDLGFREDIEFILDATPETRQTLLFSATMPREIEVLASRYQRDAMRIETVRRNEAHADIEYRAIAVAPHDIENAVVNVLRLHETRAALVFCDTREAVKRMHARLVERGFQAVALSGELSQAERTHALQALRDGRARVLVATDVAARGLDLPDLSLVIHASLPNNRETLLHRSGRTGRAGRKGLCVLVVPFNRRRKAEILLGAARVKSAWGPAPSVEEIRARDQERFLAHPMFDEAASDEDTAFARALQAARTPDEIAMALVRSHRARLPAPEELAEDTGPVRRDDRRPMSRERSPAGARPGPRSGASFDRETPREAASGDGGRAAERPAPRGSERAPPRDHERATSRPAPRGDRTSRDEQSGDGDMVWFRLNIGRERNADPRWLLPLICRAGGVSKAEVGAIKIFDRDTRFQIRAAYADEFAEAVRTNETKEGHISRVGAHTPAAGAPVDRAHPPRRGPRPDADATPASELPARAPWSKRPSSHTHAPAKAAPKPHRKGQSGAGGPPAAGSRASEERGRGHAGPAGGKPVSKYQHKKKVRAERPAKV